MKKKTYQNIAGALVITQRKFASVKIARFFQEMTAIFIERPLEIQLVLLSVFLSERCC